MLSQLRRFTLVWPTLFSLGNQNKSWRFCGRSSVPGINADVAEYPSELYQGTLASTMVSPLGSTPSSFISKSSPQKLSRITFCLTVVLLTTSQLAIAVGCPNGGAALGYYKSCWGSGSPSTSTCQSKRNPDFIVHSLPILHLYRYPWNM